ncbi:MAG: hypothetical protein A2312_04515 [Candidatus Staskawiczbacteria bacterium RIFOXYB2_FULL_32_9]|uniref:Uncharacterized protein n=1 Tax=Candidatus Staskawiczbacteria bacterium RIFOXYD1_FULL_32_13 TaxID=1802234 RepID=A0A1G2JN34_9BACT|nr:MAG: hypothetical protein UR22_C0003G0002 [Parcubacteria group bacterium GW2011_GWC2_32_10]OGZ82645.1 MAG: hypothetical protein A2312_04515 [Candidatus Staskawiczbacteria bacterium RIFOXYB2_FULL_32_9]OGZ87636.1 MAG: hypothetical protein A2463_01350 [Candidatus Staskawiczbacteria bacterium RIFOXYC2_FULL_32_10]OGZ88492.1 MAG: hypothetical protein A2561_01480 [Candidatus Staskawiczbacteria bacterium RIFOXYD1_FULL_32_13]
MILKKESEKLYEDEETRVKNEIGFIRQMCGTASNNDWEFDLLNRIWKDYSDGSLTADEAIKKANNVFESKNLR